MRKNSSLMTFKLTCSDYGFECGFVLEGNKSLSMIKKLRDHFEHEHGIDYSVDAIIQMLVNKGHTRDSIRNE
jgi:predicted small metal-binding protein